MTDPLRLTQLRADMEFAELESRIGVAQEKAAVARRIPNSLRPSPSIARAEVLTDQAPHLRRLRRRQDPLDVRIHLCWLGTCLGVSWPSCKLCRTMPRRSSNGQMSGLNVRRPVMRRKWLPCQPHTSSQQVWVQLQQMCPQALSPICALKRSQDDALRELRLKLVGAPSSRYLEAFR
jgi:hypothetical protein